MFDFSLWLWKMRTGACSGENQIRQHEKLESMAKSYVRVVRRPKRVDCANKGHARILNEFH